MSLFSEYSRSKSSVSRSSGAVYSTSHSKKARDHGKRSNQLIFGKVSGLSSTCVPTRDRCCGTWDSIVGGPTWTRDAHLRDST